MNQNKDLFWIKWKFSLKGIQLPKYGSHKCKNDDLSNAIKSTPGYLYKITESTIMDCALFFGPYGIPFTIINQVVEKEAPFL